MKSLRWLSMLVGMVLLSACAPQNIQRLLGQGEKDFETGDKTTMLFHSVLHYPSEVSLTFPGYIVGIEKSPREKVSHPEVDIQKQSMTEYGERMDEHAQRIGKDDKLLFVSHIVKNFGNRYGLGNCAQYNAYRRVGMNPVSIDPCEHAVRTPIESKSAYKASWTALENLGQDIQRELQQRLREKQNPFSHIIVMTMGWNTDQEEAVRNFNSVMKNIHVAAEPEHFDPLFIGVTWPSKWEGTWLTPIVTLFSYGNKADDADEVGFSWLGVLLHDTLKEVSEEIPLVVIGHSFGARATSMGVCVGPAIQNSVPITRSSIDLLVSLQGAYSANRFIPDEGKEGILYPKGCNNAKQIVLTSSVYDKAIDSKSWVPFVGNDETYKKYCEEKKYDVLDCVKVGKDGKIKLPSRSASKRITYINADELVRFNAYRSGGNAHSDIYRKEMGEMLWRVLDAKAPNQ